jgi:hypothetical protein
MNNFKQQLALALASNPEFIKECVESGHHIDYYINYTVNQIENFEEESTNE